MPRLAVSRALGRADQIFLPNLGIPLDGISGDYLAPMYFFEFDPATEAFMLIAGPPTNPPSIPPFAARFLPLPSGEALFSNGTHEISVYGPGGGPDPVWRPTLITIEDASETPVSVLAVGGYFRLFGRQLNGLSQAASYGDDAQMATNYPLISIRNNATGCRLSAQNLPFAFPTQFLNCDRLAG
jgi:hypothetical protein